MEAGVALLLALAIISAPAVMIMMVIDSHTLAGGRADVARPTRPSPWDTPTLPPQAPLFAQPRAERTGQATRWDEFEAALRDWISGFDSNDIETRRRSSVAFDLLLEMRQAEVGSFEGRRMEAAIDAGFVMRRRSLADLRRKRDDEGAEREGRLIDRGTISILWQQHVLDFGPEGLLVSVETSYHGTLHMLRVHNGTVKDGTREQYAICVPNTVSTVKEALAWSYGIEPGEYHEVVRT
jgi:hypothetical protein